MKFLKLWRTIKEGASNFVRNGWLSVATISILTLSLYVVSATAFLGVAAGMVVNTIEENVDISVYFNPEVDEKSIFEAKEEIESLQEVGSVKFVSNDEALEDFLDISEGDEVITQALEEIGGNPLLAALVVKAKDSNQYDIIANYIENSQFRSEVNDVNYGKNKATIDNLNRIIAFSKKTGLILGIIFLAIAVLITFNTIRLSMYSRKREFEIMRLVGASNMYIRMPSIIEGILYGISAAILSMVLILITARLISPITEGVIPQDNLVNLYFHYFWIIFGGVIALGLLLGMVSSFIAIRRYLKV